MHKELLKRIEALEIALLFLVNSLRDRKEGFTIAIPENTLDIIEKMIVKK